METSDSVAQDADVAAEDAGSGSTGIDIDEMTREALLNLLAPFSSGACSSATKCGTIEACRDAWQAAGGGQTHGAQANMRRGNLQRAEKAQHAAQVGCHSHRRRGQASTRAHFRAATLNRAPENLLFFDLRC